MLLHHVGFAVREIAPSTELYRQRYGYCVESPVIHDPLQTAFVQFLRLPGESSFLEFVAPDGPESKLAGAIKRGGGLNHLCFAVTDIEEEVRRLVGTGMTLLSEPVPATAFPGRRIAWLMGRDHLPVELVERGPEGEV